MTYVEEAIGIVGRGGGLGSPAVISFTVETDGRLPSGQALADAIDEVDRETDDAPAYFMLNCAHPTHFANELTIRGPWAPGSRRPRQRLDQEPRGARRGGGARSRRPGRPRSSVTSRSATAPEQERARRLLRYRPPSRGEHRGCLVRPRLPTRPDRYGCVAHDDGRHTRSVIDARRADLGPDDGRDLGPESSIERIIFAWAGCRR